MKKTVLFFILIISFANINSLAQNRSKSLYGELLGASQGIGINYDARFRKGAADGFGWRAGAAFGYAYSTLSLFYDFKGDVIESYNQMFRFAAPLEVNYLAGKGKSKFESGVGAVLCMDRYTSESGAEPVLSFGVIPYFSLGYRLVTKNGFLFRIGALPSYHFSSSKVSIYPYLGFGKAF